MSTTTIRNLFQQYHMAVFRYFRRMTGRGDLAEDLTQDLFLRALRGIVRYEERDREQAWLFRIARNLLLDHWKSETRKPASLDPTDGFTLSQPPTQSFSFSLQQALQKLQRPDREALILCEVGGLSYAEIAEVSETTVNSVRSRIYRARRFLRDELSGELRTAQRAVRMEKTS